MNAGRNLASGAKLLGLALVASAMLAGCACQRARHGVMLRGQWSLELNRVPWISARTVCDCDSGQPGGCSAATPASVECGHGGTSSGRPQSAGEGNSPPAEPRPAPLPAEQPAADELSQSRESGRCGIVPRLLGRCGIAGHAPHQPLSALAAAPMPPGTQEHSRFHPVPTQPVFAPRGWPMVTGPSNWRGQAPPDRASTSGSQSAAPPIQIQIAPPEAEPEGGAMQPEGKQPAENQQKQDRVTAAPEPLRLSISAATPNWIFTNPGHIQQDRLTEPLPDEPPVYRIARPGQNRNR